jgi:orotate phosphoribosyltransferase
VVLLDRQENGAERLEKVGIKLHALVNISEVASMLYEIGAINEEQLKTIQKQIKERE